MNSAATESNKRAGRSPAQSLEHLAGAAFTSLHLHRALDLPPAGPRAPGRGLARKPALPATVQSHRERHVRKAANTRCVRRRAAQRHQGSWASVSRLAGPRDRICSGIGQSCAEPLRARDRRFGPRRTLLRREALHQHPAVGYPIRKVGTRLEWSPTMDSARICPERSKWEIGSTRIADGDRVARCRSARRAYGTWVQPNPSSVAGESTKMRVQRAIDNRSSGSAIISQRPPKRF